MKIKETLKKYIRVLQVARKPGKDEFISSGKICAIGILIIGIIGFVIFLAFIFAGV